MEQPPFLHPPRYLPLVHHPPPPLSTLSEDLNIHLQHHHLIPPSPPLPPPYRSLDPPPSRPRPTYNHQSHFIFPNHRPIEDDLRIPHLLLEPPRVFSRFPSDFDNSFPSSRPDSWMIPPRILPDNQIQFSPFPAADKRSLMFREDFIDARFKPDHGEKFVWNSLSDCHSSDHDSIYHHRNDHYDSNSSRSSRKFAFGDSHVSRAKKLKDFGSTVGSYQSFRGFVLDGDRIRSNLRDENRIWGGHTRLASRSSFDACRVDAENNDFGNAIGLRVGSSRRVPYVDDSGKINYNGSREGNQECRHSRRKEIERTGDLLRIQFHKSNKRNKNGEQKIPSLFSNDLGPSTFRSRGPIVRTDIGVEQDGEGSPVELDVSFKSNALVAKAIVASPSHGTEANRNLTRNRKLPGPEMDHSKSPVIKLNSSTDGFDCPAIFNKGSKQSGGNIKDTGGKDVSGIVSQPSSHQTIELPGRSPLKEPVSDKGVNTLGSVGSSPPRIKKKVNSYVLRSQVAEKNVDLVKEDRCIDGPPTASQVGEGNMHSRERSASAAMVLVQNVNIQPSPNEVTAFLDHIIANYTVGPIASEKAGSDVDCGGSHVHNSKKTKDYSTYSVGSSNPLKTTVDEGTVIADTSADLQTISDHLHGSDELQNGSTFTGRGQVGDFSHQICQDVPPGLLQNDLLKGYLDANDISSLEQMKSHGIPVNLLPPSHYVHNCSISDNVQLKCAVSDIDALGTDSKLNEATVLAKGVDVEGFPPVVPSVENKVFMSWSSAEATNIQEGACDGYGSNESAPTTLGSGNILNNSQSKFLASENGFLGDTNIESGPDSATILFENIAMEGAPKTTMPVGGNVHTDFVKGCTTNKRKDRSYSLSSPNSSDMTENAFTVLDFVGTTLSFPAMDLNFAEDVGGVGNCSAGSQSCTDKDMIVCGYSPTKCSFDNDVSEKRSFRIGQNGTSPEYTIKRKISAPVPVLPFPMLSEIQEESTNAGTFPLSIHELGSSRFPSCSESCPVLLGSTETGASFKAVGFGGGGIRNHVSELERKEKGDLFMAIASPQIGIRDTAIGGKDETVEDPGMPQIEIVQQINAVEIQTPDSNQRLPFIDMVCESGLLVKNGLPYVSNTLYSYEHDSGVSSFDLNDEVTESAPDKLSNMDSTGILSTVTRSEIVHTEITLGHVLNQKGCEGEMKQGEKLALEDIFPSNLLNTSVQNTTIDRKPGHALGSFSSINAKLGPQDARKTTPGLNSMVGEINTRKNQLASAVPRGFPGHVLKKTTPSSHITKPRTWHRPVNPSALSHLGKNSSPSPVPTQGQPASKIVDGQTAAYIRKGNSLVRKTSPVTAAPTVSHGLTSSVYRLNPPAVQEIKERTALDATLERPKTPPLPCFTKPSNCITSSPLANPLTNHYSETESDALTLQVNLDVPKLSDDAPNSTGTRQNRTCQINHSASQNVQDDRNSVSRESKKIVYVKRKLNQLVPSSGSSDLSHENIDKSEAPSSNGYYKRRKNQIIRKSFKITQKVGLSDDSLSSEVNMALPHIASSSSRRRSGKGLAKRYKPLKSSLVWTLRGAESLKKENRFRHQVWPHLFPWKRATYRGSLMNTSASISTNSSVSTISRKLMLSRERKTIYTRSTQGFSLRKSKVLGVGGASLKWSKSIERKLKKANEEATLAVVAVEKKKREQNGPGAITAGKKSRNHSSRKLVHSIELHPGERIFRVGSVRYKMDSTGQILQRISGEELSNSAALQPGVKKYAVPKRLLIGNDEYVRIGNGNKLVRDPKKRTRILASEKVRWSLHNARLRLARKRKYCQFFTRFGKCNKDDGKCRYIHDPSKIAVCTKFLKGSCSDINCKLTHKVIPERMQDCSFFLQGLCTNESCPYRHVNVNPSASICEGFLRGYCTDGNECRKKHSYVCPTFEATGVCTQGSKCKLHHPKNQRAGKKSTSKQKNIQGRYFGTKHIDIHDRRTAVSDRHSVKYSDDIFYQEGRFADYIDLGGYDEDPGESNDLVGDQSTTASDDVGPMDIQQDDDELMKPIYLMSGSLIKEFHPVADSPSEKTVCNILELGFKKGC